MWRSKLPVLPTWKEKVRKHTGKRFGSNLAPDLKKKRNTEKTLDCSSPVRRIRFVSGSEDSDSNRLVICIPDEGDTSAVGFGPTPAIPKLVSIATSQSPAKLREEEEVDSAAFKDLLELLDEPTPSGSKERAKISVKSNPKVGMSATKKKKVGSRIGDKRIYYYDEIIEHQEKLYDSDDFQLNIEDVEKEFESLLNLYKIEYFYSNFLSLIIFYILLLWRIVILRQWCSSLVNKL